MPGLHSPLSLPPAARAPTAKPNQKLRASGYWYGPHKSTSWSTEQGKMGRKDLGGQMKTSSTLLSYVLELLRWNMFALPLPVHSQMPINPKTSVQGLKGNTESLQYVQPQRRQVEAWLTQGHRSESQNTDISILALFNGPSSFESHCCSHFTLFRHKRKSRAYCYAHFMRNICLVTYLERNM